jgi:hypothetical protein
MSKTIPSLAYSPQEAGHPGRGKTYDRLYQDYTFGGDEDGYGELREWLRWLPKDESFAHEAYMDI